LSKTLLLSILLIDDKNSHEYFCHKYNVSNNIKEKLKLFDKNLRLIKENKEFFNKDLEKNIYLYDKNHLINLNILNFVISSKIKLNNFSETLKRIIRSKTYKFEIDGKYLMKYGMQEGSLMGKVLKEIEREWMTNNFKISKERIKEIIRLHSH
jgi:tRNA nucleotidyltransferase/poly(A) polymerase